MRRKPLSACLLTAGACLASSNPVLADPQSPKKASQHELDRAGAASTISTESLLDDMVNLKRLAELPAPAYTQQQASSYDRRSKTPDDPEGWFANGDSGKYIREEDNAGRHEFVMMDADGPGAIVRIWSANPDGTLRIYLDNATTPVLEAPMKDVLGGTYSGLPRPIAGEYSKGWNLYFPIPYAKHCKVTSDKGRFYYHVNYRTYPSGTSLQSFSLDDIKRLGTQIEHVAKALEHPKGTAEPPADSHKISFDTVLAPDASQTLAELEGPQAIFGLRAQPTAKNLPAACRGLVLTIVFDGESCVECPLGDFFSTAPGLIAYDSLSTGVTESAGAYAWSHWYMPFAKSAIVRVKNMSGESVTLKGAIATTPYKWTDRSLLFHAKWRIQRDIPSRPITDWTHLEATGQGRFVGGALHIINTVRGWWGEGDEKIYVDGEKFPSTFGTGTEDYYGYAWCSPERFVHAYHNEPYCQGPGNYGNTLVSRFHIIDDIPFTTSFKFDIENWHGRPSPLAKTTRAAVSYWYARPGGKDFFRPITREDVQIQEVPAFKATIVAGAVEGEEMNVVAKTATVEPQALGEGYSGGAQLWWHDGKPGDQLVLEFNGRRRAGLRHVVIRAVTAEDYGQVKFLINGKPVSDKPFDLDGYSPTVTPAPELDLGEFEIKPGPNRLTVQIVDANPKAIKRYMFGLDYVLLK